MQVLARVRKWGWLAALWRRTNGRAQLATQCGAANLRLGDCARSCSNGKCRSQIQGERALCSGSGQRCVLQ